MWRQRASLRPGRRPSPICAREDGVSANANASGPDDDSCCDDHDEIREVRDQRDQHRERCDEPTGELTVVRGHAVLRYSGWSRTSARARARRSTSACGTTRRARQAHRLNERVVSLGATSVGTTSSTRTTYQAQVACRGDGRYQAFLAEGVA
jgi:hypothetical protein